MSAPIVYVDRSRVRDGKLEQLEAAIGELAAFVEANNPRVLSYRFFLDREDGRMTVVAVHPDSEALALHMDVGGEEFGKFAGLLELESITVYGEVSEPVVERLERKAESLGAATVSVRSALAGFARGG